MTSEVEGPANGPRSANLSPNAQAILLLTAPLLVGRRGTSRRPRAAGRRTPPPNPKPLSAAEYRDFARQLRAVQREPADLLGTDATETLRESGTNLDGERILKLLERGFLLAQAVERWRARALWIMTRADPDYPRRLKARLRENVPPGSLRLRRRHDPERWRTGGGRFARGERGPRQVCGGCGPARSGDGDGDCLGRRAGNGPGRHARRAGGRRPVRRRPGQRPRTGGAEPGQPQFLHGRAARYGLSLRPRRPVPGGPCHAAQQAHLRALRRGPGRGLGPGGAGAHGRARRSSWRS